MTSLFIKLGRDAAMQNLGVEEPSRFGRLQKKIEDIGLGFAIADMTHPAPEKEQGAQLAVERVRATPPKPPLILPWMKKRLPRENTYQLTVNQGLQQSGYPARGYNAF